jgi:hypothetical protein
VSERAAAILSTVQYLIHERVFLEEIIQALHGVTKTTKKAVSGPLNPLRFEFYESTSKYNMTIG